MENIEENIWNRVVIDIRNKTAWLFKEMCWDLGIFSTIVGLIGSNHKLIHENTI